jgi:hypothetical protein
MHENEAQPSKTQPRTPWNKGKLIGAKPPLRPRHVWSIRTRLMVEGRTRDLALFNLAIDSKLRGCDVVALKVDDVAASGYTADRATVRQQKTGWSDLKRANRPAKPSMIIWRPPTRNPASSCSQVDGVAKAA